MSKNFEIFIENITLDSELVKICEERCEEVCRFLHSEIYSSEYDGTTRLVVGPFAKKTPR